MEIFKTLNNDQLRTILKEIKELGKQKIPLHAKQSETLKQLFALQKKDYYTWIDTFGKVKQAIEIEILKRIETDKKIKYSHPPYCLCLICDEKSKMKQKI